MHCWELIDFDSFRVILHIFIYLVVIIYLFQVCKIVEGQRYSKRLNERQITALLKVTCQRPNERENDILRVCVTTRLLFMSAELLIRC